MGDQVIVLREGGECVRGVDPTRCSPRPPTRTWRISSGSTEGSSD